MCLTPKIPAAPEPPPPPPESVIPAGALPTTVSPTKTSREALRQASSGTSSLTIPLSVGGSSVTPTTGNASTGSTNLSIGS